MVIKWSYSTLYAPGALKDDWNDSSSKGWKSIMTQWDSEELEKFLKSNCYTAFNLIGGYKIEKNCTITNVYIMDVDAGGSFNLIKDLLIAKGFAFALITTNSHQQKKEGKPVNDRFRIIIPLIRDIDKKEWNLLNDYFGHMIPIRDSGSTNASRYFFVSPKNAIFYISPPETRLFDPNIVPSVMKYKIKEKDKNEITFDEDMQITLSDGTISSVRELNLPSDESTYPCYCNFHADETPSAFISRTKTGRYMMHCTACKAENRQSTFWCGTNTVTTKDKINFFYDHIQGKSVLVLDLDEDEIKKHEIPSVKWFGSERDLANYLSTTMDIKTTNELNEFETSLPRYVFTFNPSEEPGIKPSTLKGFPGKYNRFKSSSYLEMQTTQKHVFDIDFLKIYTPYFHALLQNLFNLDQYIHYYLNFLAYIAQKRKKPPVAFIISTNPGAGKETLFQCVLQPIFNKSHTISLSLDELTREFNGFDFDKWCVIYDEAQGSRFFEEARFASALNTMITSEENKIRELYQSPIWVKDYRFFTVFSNSEKPLPIPDDDRRFYVIRNRESINMMELPLYLKTTPQKDWDIIAKCIINELPLIVKFLHELVLETTWISKAQITDAKEEMKASLKTPMQRLADAVCDGNAEDIEGWDSIIFPSEKQKWEQNSEGRNILSTTSNFDRVKCSECISKHYVPGAYMDLILRAVNNNLNKITRQEAHEHFIRIKKETQNIWVPKKYKGEV
jgi:hypothetical protein